MDQIAFACAAAPDPEPAQAMPVIEVDGLAVQFLADEGVVRAVDGVSFAVGSGESVGIVGESGSGKSVTALALMRLLDEPGRIAAGSIRFQGRDVLRMGPEELRRLRGGGIAMVFQDPMTSLNPVLRISRQLVETMVVHGRLAPAAAERRGVALLGRMGITAPEQAIHSFPHQFSGGMRQRVMLAMGFSNEPALLIADEPTTALDVTIQAQILELIRELNADFGAAILLISHDLGVVASVCSRVLVMYAGEVVEEGPTEAILAAPKHPYTWALINAAPRLDRRPQGRRLTTIEGAPPDPLAWPSGCRFAPRCPFRIARCDEHPPLRPVGPGRQARCWISEEGRPLESPRNGGGAASGVAPRLDHSRAAVLERGTPLLEVRGLVKHFPLRKIGFFGPQRVVHAVDGVDLDVAQGETVGLVGESGCGKSTLARVVVRIQRPTAGSIRFAGQEIAGASASEIRPLRRHMQMIFQDPYASLNPRMTVAEILGEPLRWHAISGSMRETKERIAELLAVVGLGSKAATRYPHEFSGGQRQRISIARALAVQPDFVIADEPISALDVNIQAQIINLLVDLQERFGLAYLFIAHDLAVVRHISDRIVVLYLGRVMETAAAEALFAMPLHPYTRHLISAVPVADPEAQRRRRHRQLQGEPPSAILPPSGCVFRTRCPIAKPVCAEIAPPLAEAAAGRQVACHFPGEF
jgi:peptide/nickel transport system ATP-binding protein